MRVIFCILLILNCIASFSSLKILTSLQKKRNIICMLFSFVLDVGSAKFVKNRCCVKNYQFHNIGSEISYIFYDLGIKMDSVDA